MLIGGILVPAGLMLYGWAAERHFHWAIVDTGCMIMCMGLIIAFQSAQAYIVDAYEARYAASAAAVGAFLRTMCGFSFPLFAPQMYKAMRLGWGNTMLGLITLALAIPSPILLWFYGSRIRAMSTKGLI